MSSQCHNAPANSIHFFKIILESCLRDGELRIPRGFVSKYGENLPNPVFLMLPNGDEWKVNWVKRDGDVWFQKGWKAFAEHYSLAHGHFLVFGYEEKSKIQVLIFDMSALEIIYPMPKATEDGDAIDRPIEISHECPPRKRKRARSPMQKSHQPQKKMRTSKNGEAEINFKPQYERSKLNVELDTPKPKIRGGSRRGSRRGTEKYSNIIALERAKASCSKTVNPNFIRIIHPTYIHNNFLGISSDFSKTYLYRKEGMAILRVSEERTWRVKFYYSSSNRRTYLGSGWKIFVEENNLKPGDVCFFEMTESTVVSFKIAIFHATEGSSSPSLPDSDQTPKAASKFQSKNHFTIHIKPSHVMNAKPNVPIDFAKRYIGSDGKDVIVQVGERSWTLKLVYYPDHAYARFSAGWSAFLSGCNLMPGDICQFEMIDEENLVLKFTKIQLN